MRLLASVAMVLLCGAPAAAADAPAWARQLASADGGGTSAAAVVLLDDVDVTVTADGKIRTLRRYAIRLRERAGRDAASLDAVYVNGSDRVNALRAWILRPGAAVRELGGREAVDAALVNNDIYNEVRVRSIGARDDVAPGDTFAAEIETEGRLLFAQLEWQLQGRWPVKVARRRLALPADWRANAVVFNGAPVEARRDAAAHVWELRDLPSLPDEPAMPPATDLALRLAVSFFGPASSPAPGQFATWHDVSAWLHGLSDAAGRPSETVAAKAREITAPASTDFERAAAIGRYAQRVQYVSIQTGLGRGGGYVPRPAPLVFERNYGDCKDKASLMRAMLSALGIKSYLVTIFAGDRNYVRAEWPSPQQFNHAIIAMSLASVPDGVTSVVDHPELGRLVLFDPTDEHTPFGELPLHEQGSLALIVAPSGTTLVKAPLTPADHHRIERTIDGSFGPNGSLSALFEETSTGGPAVSARAMHARLDEAAYRGAVAHRVASAIPRAHVAAVTVAPEPTGAFRVRASVESAAYLQAQGSLVVFTPPLGFGARHVPPAAQRQTALLIEPNVVRETVRLKLPAGYVVDEMPPSVKMETPFGRYSVTYSSDGGYFTSTRSLETSLQSIGPQQYPAARAFFDRVLSADAAPVVLVKR